MFKALFLAFIIFPALSAGLQDKLDARRSGSKAPKEVRAIMERSTNELKESGIEKSAIKEKMSVPEFALGNKSIREILKNGKVVLKFYRGSWCPYCMIELKEYQSMYDKFKKSGCQLIAISPDTKLEIKKMKKNFGFTFPIYADQNNAIAKKFGLAFKLSDDLQSVYKKFGIDLEKSHGNNNQELPLPGTYVIDSNGKVIYAFFDVDYTKRAEPIEVLSYCK